MPRSSAPDRQAGSTRFRAMVLPVAGMVLAIICTGCGADHEKNARELFARHDYQAAEEEYGWALRAHPGDHDLEYNLAQCQARCGKREEALKHLDKLAKFPEWTDRALAQMAQIYADQGSFDVAFQTLDKLIAAHPDRADLVEARGQLWGKRALAAQEAFRKWLAEAIDGTEPKPVADRTFRLRVLPAAEFEKRLSETIEQLKTDKVLADEKGFREKFNPVRQATLRMEADYTAASARSPLVFRADFELGNLAVERMDSDLAIKFYSKVLAIDDATLPDKASRVAFNDIRVRSLEAVTGFLEKRERYADALKILEPEYKSEWIAGLEPLMERMARLYLVTGRRAEAAKVAEELIKGNTRSPWANYVRGQLMMAESKPAAAMAYLERAHTSARTNADISRALGFCYSKLGNDSAAADQLRLALVGLPRDVELNLEYAQVLSRYGAPVIARDFLEDQLRTVFTNSASPEHQRLLAEVRSIFGQSAAGLKTLEDAQRALHGEGGNPYVKLAVAKFEHEAGLNTIALPRCLEVTRTFPGLSESWALAAKICSQLNMNEDAVKYARRARAITPNDANLPWIEAIALKKLDRPLEARAAAERAVELDSKLPGSKLFLLELELDQRNFARAGKLAEELVKDYPDDPRVRRAIAKARIGNGDSVGALASLRQAEAQDQSDPDVKLMLGDALIAAGSTDEGAQKLLDAIRIKDAPRNLKRSAADSLSKAKLPAAAADAYSLLVESATSEAERTDLQTRVFLHRTWANDAPGAIDELLKMKQAGRGVAAQRIFVANAARQGAVGEGAAVADALRVVDGHNADSLRGAIEAHLAMKQWVKALDDADDINRLGALPAGEIALARARAHLGLNHLTEAAPFVADAVAKLSGGMKAQALETAVKLAVLRGDGPLIHTALRQLLAENNFSLLGRITAAEGLIRAGQATEAAEILSLMPKIPNAEPDDLAKAAALLAIAGDVNGAATRLKELPQSRDIRSLAGLVDAVGMRSGAAPGTFAAMCARLVQRDFAGAGEAIGNMDEQSTFRQHLRSLIKLMETAPENVGLATRELAIARLVEEAQLQLPERAIDAVNRAAALYPQNDRLFAIHRAAAHLRFGRARQAVEIVGPLLENERTTGIVLFTAAVGALDSVGVESAMKFFTTLDGPKPPDFVRDFAIALALRGFHLQSRQVLTTLPTLRSDEQLLLMRIAVERHEVTETEGALAALPPNLRELLESRLAVAWTKSRGDEAARRAAAVQVKIFAARPDDAAKVDRELLFETALLSKCEEEARAEFEGGLKRARFSTAEMGRWAALLKRLNQKPEWLATLEERLKFLDPAGNLRQVAPRPIRM